MTIDISQEDFLRLMSIARKYVLKGQPPLTTPETLHRIIEKAWKQYNPPVWKEIGFDRQ